MLDALSESGRISLEEERFKKKLQKNLKKSGDAYDCITLLINNYLETGQESSFKENIISEYKTFSRHYLDRKTYHVREESYKRLKGETLITLDAATKVYQEQRYDAAVNLFTRAITLSTDCYIDSEPTLSLSYHNLGKSLFKVAEPLSSAEQLIIFRKAKFFLEQALSLRINNREPESYIKKTATALAECNKKSQDLEPTEQLTRQIS